MIAAGNEKIVYNLLEFDQQESSAPAGVYPSYTFTNNDSEIIVWAKRGKLVRYDRVTQMIIRAKNDLRYHQG